MVQQSDLVIRMYTLYTVVSFPLCFLPHFNGMMGWMEEAAYGWRGRAPGLLRPAQLPWGPRAGSCAHLWPTCPSPVTCFVHRLQGGLGSLGVPGSAGSVLPAWLPVVLSAYLWLWGIVLFPLWRPGLRQPRSSSKMLLYCTCSSDFSWASPNVYCSCLLLIFMGFFFFWCFQIIDSFFLLSIFFKFIS